MSFVCISMLVEGFKVSRKSDEFLKSLAEKLSPVEGTILIKAVNAQLGGTSAPSGELVFITREIFKMF